MLEVINVLSNEEIKRRMSSLHNHTSKSLLDATISAEELIKQACDLGFNAVAITEHGNMFSIIDGYKAAQKLGIKFIAGCEIYETTDMSYKEKDSDRYHLLLLAKSKKGLVNLNKIVSMGFLEGFYVKARVDLALLSQYSEDIIAMTACLGSRIDRLLYDGRCSCCTNTKIECSNFEPKWDEAIEWVNKYKEIFGDNFYIELQSHDTEGSAKANPRLLKLAQMTNTKFTITFDTHMKDGSDTSRDIHRMFLKIGQDREDADNQIIETYNGCWQQTIEEVHKVMDKHIGYENVELGIDTTDEISSQCDLTIDLHQDLMPNVDIPAPYASPIEYLKHLVDEGWYKRGFDKFSKDKRVEYRQRLDFELAMLEYLDYSNYFIMNAIFIAKCRERQIPLGYSRGSGANTLVFFTIGVTEVDSIRWDLEFSRFANKGRKGSPADYDIDMSQLKRAEALEILSELFEKVESVEELAKDILKKHKLKYEIVGKNTSEILANLLSLPKQINNEITRALSNQKLETKIAQVITFNSATPKVCIRDLGKVFDEEGIYNIPYKIRDKISKLIPDDPNKKMTIERALESSAELRKFAEKYPKLFEYTKALQNLPKSAGCHASAVLVTPRPLVEFGALMYNKDGNVMFQLEMHNAMDDIGLVKLDFLGLKTLDVVDLTLKLAGLTWADISLDTLDLDDKRVFEEIFNQGNTLGVFQMETPVPTDMFVKMKADSVEDVFAVNAMNRPAILSVGMDKVYIDIKKNPHKAKYIHEDLRSIFEKTNSIMLYQEQALKCFRLADFPEDETDVARRAIGKKKEEVMKTLFAKFTAGLRKRGWTEDQIEALWKLIAAQAEYSFNRGHSVSYGLLAYLTAWLKLYYPVEFMTALLTSEIGDYKNTTKYIDECFKMDISVTPPNINSSLRAYTMVGKKILFGIESIKGVGEKAVDIILNERDNNGDFKSITDFISRCKVDITTIISLIKSGAFGRKKEDLLLKFADFRFEKKEYKYVKTLPKKEILLDMKIIKDTSQIKGKENKEAVLEKYNKFREIKFNKEAKQKYKDHMENFREKYMDTPEMYEFETLSIFINGTPFDKHREHFESFYDYQDSDRIILCGTITDVKNKKQRKGGRMAYVSLLTFDGVLEGLIFNTQYQEYVDLIKKGTNIVILGNRSGEQFIIEKVKSFDVWKSEKLVEKDLKEKVFKGGKGNVKLGN